MTADVCAGVGVFAGVDALGFGLLSVLGAENPKRSGCSCCMVGWK